MLRKTPRTSFPSIFKLIAGGAIIIEAGIFGASYLLWRKLNTSRDYRKTIGAKYPWALNTYYWFGEVIDKNCPIRLIDEKVWEEQKQQSVNPQSH